jgi:rod shape-determining protein MreC
MALSTAESEQRGYRGDSPGLRFAVMCLISIALMVTDNRSQLLQDVRRVLAATAYPLQVLVDSPAAAGRWISESLATRTQLREENERLSRQLLEQSARLQRFAAMEAENARLRALLDSTAKVGDRVLIGEIMSVDMNPFRHRIVINKGSKDDVFVGQAVIDADGVIGQVTRDRILTAEAILITDIDHALPVEVVRNRQRTIAVGTGRLDRLSLPFLPRNADVRVGDLLVTSGLGGSFPPGYPVGVIKSLGSEAGDEFLTVEAEPSAALSRIREVLLIWPGAEVGAEDTQSTPTDDPPASETAPGGPPDEAADLATPPAAAAPPPGQQ